MKVIWFIALFILVVVSTLVLAGQVGLLKGKAPSDIGVHDGRLKPPSPTPNSVSSQADLYPEHPQRTYAQIEPIKFTGDGEVAMAKIADILKNSAQTEIIRRDPGYVYAQSTSRVLRFTDDIEFWLDTSAGVIHVRSASRLGGKDLHVNRARVEAIRAQFTRN